MHQNKFILEIMICILIFLTSCNVQPPIPSWEYTAYNSSGVSSRFDNFGNTYLLSAFYGLSKVSTTGQEIWKLESLLSLSPHNLASDSQFLLDSTGNAYLIAPLFGSNRFESTGVFGAKITKDGVVDWHVAYQYPSTNSIKIIGSGLSRDSTAYFGLAIEGNFVEIFSINTLGMVSAVAKVAVAGTNYRFYVGSQDNFLLHSDEGLLIQFNHAGQRIGEISDLSLKSAAKSIIASSDGTIYITNDSGIFKYSISGGLLWSKLLNLPIDTTNVKSIVGAENDIIALYYNSSEYKIVRLNSAGQEMFVITTKVPEIRNKTIFHLNAENELVKEIRTTVNFDMDIDSFNNFYLLEFINQKITYNLIFTNPDPILLPLELSNPKNDAYVSKFNNEGQLVRKISIAGLGRGDSPLDVAIDAIHVNEVGSLTINGTSDKLLSLLHYERIFE